MSNKHLIIDADLFLYQDGKAVDSQYSGGPVNSFSNLSEAVTEGSSKPPFSFVKQAIRYSINSCCKENKTDSFTIVLGPNSGNFREKVAVTKGYKSNRKDNDKPSWFYESKEWLVKEYGAKIAEGMEGDDLAAILHMKDLKNNILCSADKDLDMIPGLHYKIHKKQQVFINRTEAFRNFCMQMLTGDSGDAIPGCNRIGITNAKRLLTPVDIEDLLKAYKYLKWDTSELRARYKLGMPDPDKFQLPYYYPLTDKADMWDVVEKAYERQGHNKEYLIEQATLLWIMREEGGIFDYAKVKEN